MKTVGCDVFKINITLHFLAGETKRWLGSESALGFEILGSGINSKTCRLVLYGINTAESRIGFLGFEGNVNVIRQSG